MTHYQLSAALARATFEWRNDPHNLLREWSQILCRHLIDNPKTDWRVRRHVDSIEFNVLRTISEKK